MEHNIISYRNSLTNDIDKVISNKINARLRSSIDYNIARAVYSHTFFNFYQQLRMMFK